MNILHVGIASFFTEEMNYQEQCICKCNIMDGHTTTFISNAYKFENGTIIYTGSQDVYTDNGLRIIRIPYYKFLGEYWGGKLKSVPGLYKTIVKVAPDVIMYHGTGGLAIRDVVKYVKRHPDVKLYVDSHEDFNNSAKNWVSKNIQHKLIHGPLTRYAYPYIEKLFYISEESKDFLTELYKIKDKLEFYPLGGFVVDDEDRVRRRARVRDALGVKNDDVLLCHSGKMDKLKRTEDILRALVAVKADNLRLVLIGSLPDDAKERILGNVNLDDRVSYLGWKPADELMDYLCACDVYVQPGSQSATMQNAICCGAAVMLYPHKSHAPYVQGNGWFVETVEDMEVVFSEIAAEPGVLKEKSENSFRIANDLLDYKKLAARLYI